MWVAVKLLYSEHQKFEAFKRFRPFEPFLKNERYKPDFISKVQFHLFLIQVHMDGVKNNYQMIVAAFLTGLAQQETHEQLAERKGMYVVEFRKEEGYR